MTYKGLIYDYHVHSNFSFDCDSSVEAICEQALLSGLSGLMFTDHIELDFKGNDYFFDYDAYVGAVTEAREKYPMLTVGCGLEMGIQPHLSDRLQEAIGSHRWDFIIGSIHIINNLLVYNGEFAADRDKKQTYREYLERVFQAVKAAPSFDILGHIDLIRRDNTYNDRALLWKDFPDELDAILRELIKRGSGIEINTASVRYGLEGFHPHISVLKRYRELGGEIITCGADSHYVFHAGSNLREAYQLLVDAGFKYISTFDKRILHQIPLDI